MNGILAVLAFVACARVAPPPDPCDDLDALAAEYRAAGQFEAEIEVRSLLVQSGDPLDQYNLIVALADGGYPVDVDALRECVARVAPGDELLPHILVVLADEVDDPEEARALVAQADYLMELAHGQDPEEEDPPAIQAPRAEAAEAARADTPDRS